MAVDRIALMAHLLRRAGFGASRDELEAYAARPYEAVVDDLVHPERLPELEDDVLGRYYPHLAANRDNNATWNGRWFYRMVNTRRPLEEKMALFWHHVFATGWTKSEHTPAMVQHIQMLRRNGLANLRTLLLDLSRDPAMIYWLDNNENHAGEINENYGRELLELFSMGIGNYTETDIKNVARAFTGWTFEQPIPLYPYGHYPSAFVYRADDHDESEKTFLGQTGSFNGEDIVEIIVKQEATARFICRHIYNFFVADEPQVPAWSATPPRDPDAVATLMKSYFDSDADIRSVMQTLFNSDFFKAARFTRVKCPAELIAGTLKLSGDYRSVEPGLQTLDAASIVMGQKLMDPPTVEGWHTGKEWIDGGTLTERVNFAVNLVKDVSKPGPRLIAERLSAAGPPIGPAEFVDRCLDLAGPLEVCPETRTALLEFAESEGHLTFGSEAERNVSEARIGRMLTLIVASREYQFA
ncbi:MAG TPA: DUF1800 domain-containing protein [Chloroflexota bacterium]|nr:DUF1800 domain-containing protein [Chloroflexota bacterium]